MTNFRKRHNCRKMKQSEFGFERLLNCDFSKTIHSIKLNTIKGIKIVLDFQVEAIICKTKVK